MCHYGRVFRPFTDQVNVSNPVFRREQVRKRLGSQLEGKRKVNLAKVKYRNLPVRFWISVLASATDGTEKYDRCPIHILVFMQRPPMTSNCPDTDESPILSKSSIEKHC